MMCQLDTMSACDPYNFRAFPCGTCGGDRGFDVPHDIDRYDGSLITQWVECTACDGLGEYEAELMPIDCDELDEVCGVPQ